MHPSDALPRHRLDWRASLALAWALAFGILYAQMVARQRGATVAALLNAAPSWTVAPANPTGR